MRIENQDLINDILTIVARGPVYINEVGEEFTAVPFSDIQSTLTDRWNGLFPGGRYWKSVSHIDAADLREAGFKILRRGDNPNSADHRGDWRIKG